MLKSLQLALEVAHYAARHRSSVVVLALGPDVLVEDILLDLKLVRAHSVPTVVVVPPDQTSRSPLVDARAEGLPLEITSPDATALRTALGHGALPLVGVADAPTAAVSLARALGARLIQVRPVDEPPPSAALHLGLDEARRLDVSPGLRPTWDAVVAALDDPAGLPAAVFVPGAPGNVFAELFTHRGAGLLLGDPLVERVRPARITDAADLELLLRAEVERGVLRPIPIHDIPRTAHQHLVYTIDGLVVATARLRPYGTWAELSRFATLPRYRGRGRARRLGEALLEEAAARGYSHVFALSVDARMWRFFESLGMHQTRRRALPDPWQESYDFCRPSRAFVRDLGSG